jgi:medium-chain acyl-[acyl-carrier-protein] hydrolase
MNGHTLERYRKDIPVRLADVDLNGHVNNTHYVEWLAEGMPEEIWGEREIREVHVEFKKAARYGDTVRMETERREREFSHLLHSVSSESEFVRAITRWTP